MLDGRRFGVGTLTAPHLLQASSRVLPRSRWGVLSLYMEVSDLLSSGLFFPRVVSPAFPCQLHTVSEVSRRCFALSALQFEKEGRKDALVFVCCSQTSWA